MYIPLLLLFSLVQSNEDELYTVLCILCHKGDDQCVRTVPLFIQIVPYHICVGVTCIILCFMFSVFVFCAGAT